MTSRGSQIYAFVAGAVLMIFAAAATEADVAVVVLRDGTRLRGDVRGEPNEIVVQNLAGEVRLAKRDVASVEWVDEAESLDVDYARRQAILAQDDTGGMLALAEWAAGLGRRDWAREQCRRVLQIDAGHAAATALLNSLGPEATTQVASAATQPGASEPAAAGQPELPVPKLLSELDIRRLKLYEYPIYDPPERLRIRISSKPGEVDVLAAARREAAAGDFDRSIRDLLDSDKPHEQVAGIVAVSGAKYAEQIEISGDLPSFATFRKKILPLVRTGCATAGCHGGGNAVALRLPSSGTGTDEYVYTMFVLLDATVTQSGPLINRDSPEESTLVTFMLPRAENPRPHPPVASGRVTPRLKSTRDPNYQMILDWVSSLRTPHPDYQLEYLRSGAASQPAAPGPRGAP